MSKRRAVSGAYTDQGTESIAWTEEEAGDRTVGGNLQSEGIYLYLSFSSRSFYDAPMRLILRWVLQIFIGVIIFGSALGKSLDLPGFVEVLKTYQAFAEALLWPITLTVTGFEFVLGAWVLSGWRLAISALVAVWLNAGYAVWMTITLLRGLELANCGCFGVFFPQPLLWYSPLEDLVLVGMCWGLARLSSDRRGPAAGATR
ncbi:MAG: MauE/DoxX family redox-associated membrane protein [Nitrospiraceae bacterium]